MLKKAMTPSLRTFRAFALTQELTKKVPDTTKNSAIDILRSRFLNKTPATSSRNTVSRVEQINMSAASNKRTLDLMNLSKFMKANKKKQEPEPDDF